MTEPLDQIRELLEKSGNPGPVTRAAIIANAGRIAAQRRAARRRPVLYGGLAAALLAVALIVPLYAPRQIQPAAPQLTAQQPAASPAASPAAAPPTTAAAERQNKLAWNQAIAGRSKASDAADPAPLLLAIRQRQAGAVQRLLAQGADPNAADARGMTPLALAKELHDARITALLIDAGAHEPAAVKDR